MNLPGYCTGCRKPKRVHVTGNALVLGAVSGVVQGLCDDCANPPKPCCTTRYAVNCKNPDCPERSRHRPIR